MNNTIQYKGYIGSVEFSEDLPKLGHSRAVDILRYQLEQKRSLFPNFVKHHTVFPALSDSE